MVKFIGPGASDIISSSIFESGSRPSQQ